MQLKNTEILEALNCFKKLLGIKLLTRLKYTIIRNVKKLEPIKEAIDEARKGDDITGYVEYIKKGQELFRSRGEGSEEDFKKALKDLDAEYPETVKEVQEKEKEIKSLLETEEELGAIMLSLDDFPKEIEIDISPIFCFLKEE